MNTQHIVFDAKALDPISDEELLSRFQQGTPASQQLNLDRTDPLFLVGVDLGYFEVAAAVGGHSMGWVVAQMANLYPDLDLAAEFPEYAGLAPETESESESESESK